MSAPRKAQKFAGADSDSGASATAEVSGTYEGLARRYRPQTFQDVIGQKAVVQTLRKAVQAGRWSSSYLFIGGRGLGKTTMARILAKALLCERGPTPEPCGECESCLEIASSRHIDVLEIDAASNTGVDNVRDTIIQAVATSPVKGRVKIFIIDEVHMLSQSAFNALLKTIEEPPPHVLFIMATTDGHKVPATIRSRCQRFDFRPLAPEELGERLGKIAKEEGIVIDEGAINVICDYAEGGVRDAISALDLVRAFAADHITAETAEDALGVIPATAIQSLLERISEADAAGAQARFTSLLAAGADPSEILRGLLQAFRRLLLDEVNGRSGAFTRGRLVRSLESILVAADRARFSRHPRLEAEVLICRLAGMTAEEVTMRDLYSRLLEMERGGSARSDAASPGGAGPERLSPGAAEGRALPEAAPINTIETASVAQQAAQVVRGEPGVLSEDRFQSELERISPVAAALARGARVALVSPNRVTLRFLQASLFDRYRKDLKAQVAVASALEGLLGGRVTVTAELTGEIESAVTETPREALATDSAGVEIRTGPASAKPAASAVEAGKRGKKEPEELDPEIERIRKLFGAEIVEVIE
jgi:DNA polymerase-3 subunit gamma/tau